MSARVTVEVSTVASPPPAPKTVTGTLFAAGTVGSGPSTVQKISGLAEFRALYGTRATANAALHDALQTFFAEGGSVAYVAATTSPTPDWDAVLELFTADLGPGAVCITGIGPDAATPLGTHCETTGRLGLVAAEETETATTAATNAATISGEDGSDHLVYVWPWVTVPGLEDPIEPLGFAAGVRARAHAANVAQSPIQVDFGSSRFVNGVETASTDAEWETLNTAKVSTVRVVSGKVRMYGWKLTALMAGDTSGNLNGAQFRDVLNAIKWDASQIAERFVGRLIDGRGVTLGAFYGDLTGLLSSYTSKGALFAKVVDGKEIDPGYTVNVGESVNSAIDLAAGELKAEIGMRLSPTAEFVTITVAATDAAGTI